METASARNTFEISSAVQSARCISLSTDEPTPGGEGKLSSQASSAKDFFITRTGGSELARSGLDRSERGLDLAHRLRGASQQRRHGVELAIASDLFHLLAQAREADRTDVGAARLQRVGRALDALQIVGVQAGGDLLQAFRSVGEEDVDELGQQAGLVFAAERAEVVQHFDVEDAAGVRADAARLLRWNAARRGPRL